MCRRVILFLVVVFSLCLVNGAWADLLAYWQFDEGSGDTVEDMSGNGNHGTIEGAEWVTNAIFGSALQFDGVDDRVVVPDSASLHPQTGDITVEGWVNVASDPKAWRSFRVTAQPNSSGTERATKRFPLGRKRPLCKMRGADCFLDHT